MKVNWQELRSFGISKHSKRYSPFSLQKWLVVSIVSVDNRNNMLHSICAVIMVVGMVYRSLRNWRFCKGKATSEWRSREENEKEQRETYSLLCRSFSPLPRSYSWLRRSLSWLYCSFSWLCCWFSRLCCSFFWFRRSFLWVCRKLTLHSPKKKARYTG